MAGVAVSSSRDVEVVLGLIQQLEGPIWMTHPVNAPQTWYWVLSNS